MWTDSLYHVKNRHAGTFSWWFYLSACYPLRSVRNVGGHIFTRRYFAWAMLYELSFRTPLSIYDTYLLEIHASIPSLTDDQCFSQRPSMFAQESFMVIASMACTHHKDELPVWTHPWVCISEKHRFDQPALWLWVNEILLDSSNEALILDCCVMPVARMDDPVSAQLRETIELQDGPSFVASKVRFRGDVLFIGCVPEK